MNKAKPGPIGIDLSGSCLHAVQLETVDGAARLFAAASDVSAGGSTDLPGRIDRLLGNHHFAGRRITTVIPPKALGIHNVQLPAMSDEAEAEGIAAEVCKRLNCRAEELVIRHMETSTGAGRGAQAEFVAFTVARSVVEEHLRLADKLGLELVGITALPLAMGYAFSYLGQRREEAEFTFLLVHLAERTTYLLAVHRGEIRLARGLPYGVHDMIDAVARATDRSASELKEEQELQMRRHGDQGLLESRGVEPPAPAHVGAVPYEQAGEVLQSYCEEITSSMCYYAGLVGSPGIDKVVFAGPQANDYEFCQMLANRLGVAAQVGDPLAGMRSQGDAASGVGASSPPRPELAVSAGLSLFGTLVDRKES